ncbi:MAG: cysteine--tRNA ligase, partial [Desulfurococcales archaeon]|nr:cysteine--tRNA ligase [Desulfurococcales archaeon]
ESSAVLGAMYKALYDMDKVYGVLSDKLSPEEIARKTSGIAEDLVELLLEVRKELRERRMYDLADKIRSRLAGLGVEVVDFKDKSEWRWKKTVA